MDNKKPVSFIFTIIAIILGVVLFKQFDFKELQFEKPALAIIYGITLAASIFILVKNAKNQTKK
ncbi:hypothetical protein [Flavobacterium wongokense]|uniref:hypothetical protein n=1 Tax=Flavobacterium wongokense TaxID=2910674 RepID=UPI001F1A61E4|nr:hypothetical protein [Flavobacterium sp. WG47]MCF6132576.1 hypothetical protein [Flavobacterium sp. WG47]